jgi:hypothetical protein
MKHKINRRAFLQSAGLAAAGLAAAACGPRVPTGQAALTQAPSTSLAAASPTAMSATAVSATETQAPALPDEARVLGHGQGIAPGRVVWAYNPAAARWDGKNGYWWQPENTDFSLVAEMLAQGLRAQTAQTGAAAAWQALFAHFKTARGKSGQGYQPGEKIAIKINVNYCQKHNYKGNGSFTNPAAVLALLQQLVGPAGVPAEAITVYDAVRAIPNCILDACASAELGSVKFVDFLGGGGREQSERDPNVVLRWSQDVGGSPAYLPTCVTSADYMINLSGLKGHNLAGVTLSAKNHFGTILADWKGERTLNSPQGANLHGFIAAHDFDAGPEWQWPQRPMGSYNALVDLMAHPHLGGKTLLYILDGIYPAPQQNAEVTLEGSQWQSAPFNGNWTSSLFLSQDGVAIDSVGYDFLSSEPVILAQKDVLPPGHSAQNYLHEAAQADQAPSGAAYAAASLGVHDHWDSPQTRRYARNLGGEEGIELVTLA